MRRGRVLVFIGVVLLALNLRTAVAAISPIVDRISVELALDPVALGVLGATPPLAFAASGVIGPFIVRRVGLERALVLAIVVMIAGHLGRTLAASTLMLVLATIVTLLGVGVANVLLPPIVKRYFPHRVGAVTALYATVMSVGATIPALIAVPVADGAGWRVSLGVWFASALIVAIPWVAGLLGRHDQAHDAATRAAEAVETGALPVAARLGVVRSRVAWSIAGVFAMASFGAYAAFAWLPLLLTDLAGVDAAAAGGLLALFTIAGFPAALLVPVLASRLRSATPLVVAGIAFHLAGYLGLILVPTTATWLWVLFAGLGPLMFPLALALIGLRSRTTEGAVALSGFVQGFGYLIGAAGPFLVGIIHSATGGWIAPLWLLLGAAVFAIPALFVLARGETVEDELERRAA